MTIRSRRAPTSSPSMTPPAEVRDPIADLVHRYADAVVHRDEAAWRATWSDDAYWDLGGFPVEGIEAVVSLWSKAMDGFESVIQLVHNGCAFLDESTGSGDGRWYIEERLANLDGSSSHMIGHYDDTYRRVGDRWLFASRVLTTHLQETL